MAIGSKIICGIDPGKTGAFCFFMGRNLRFMEMPLVNDEVDFDRVQMMLARYRPAHVFLERAVSFGMGTKGAFNYGRAFAALEIAIKIESLPVTYVEPTKWTKVMHEGISKDLKAKVKSTIAIKRLYPKVVDHIPGKMRKGEKILHEGIVDAILIAGFGMRHYQQK